MTHNACGTSDAGHSVGESISPRGDEHLLSQIATLAGEAAASNLLPPWYRPVVALPTSGFISQHGRWSVDGVERAIGKALSDAGADAYFFPCRPVQRQENPFLAVWQVLRRVDAVLVPGGLSETVPGWFAHSISPQTGSAEWWEDWWRWHLVKLAILLCVPFLGIDQGASYLNTALGGQLYQDITTEAPSFGQHRARGALDADSWSFNVLEVLSAESRIATCANGDSHIWGACMHHQAVKQLAPGLLLTARAMGGCPEVVERADAFFGVGTWSHPEQDYVYETQRYARNLFATLCESALVYAASRASRLEDGMEALREDIWSYLHTADPPRLVLTAGEWREVTRGGTGAGEEETLLRSTDAIRPV